MMKGICITLMFCFGLYLSINSVRAQDSVDPLEGNIELHVQWVEQFQTYLESSEHTQFQIISAVRLLKETGDPKLIERGEQLIAKVLENPALDAASLWLLASDCQWRRDASWCQPGGVYEKLALADPENAAVSLLHLNQISHGGDVSQLDTEANRQLLARISETNHFDVYWGRGLDKLFEEALTFIELTPVPPLLELEDSIFHGSMAAHVYAFSSLMSLTITAPSYGYGNMSTLCRLYARNRDSEGVAACKTLARILRENSKTLLTRSIGFGIEKAMLQEVDPNDPGIRHWQIRGDAFKLIYMCQSLPWQTDEQLLLETEASSLMNWATNISDLGEWKGNRQTSIQEFTNSSEHFILNPEDCDRLYSLDDESIEILLNGHNPIEAWRIRQKDILGVIGVEQ